MDLAKNLMYKGSTQKVVKNIIIYIYLVIKPQCGNLGNINFLSDDHMHNLIEKQKKSGLTLVSLEKRAFEIS